MSAFELLFSSIITILTAIGLYLYLKASSVIAEKKKAAICDAKKKKEERERERILKILKKRESEEKKPEVHVYPYNMKVSSNCSWDFSKTDYSAKEAVEYIWRHVNVIGNNDTVNDDINSYNSTVATKQALSNPIRNRKIHGTPLPNPKRDNDVLQNNWIGVVESPNKKKSKNQIQISEGNSNCNTDISNLNSSKFNFKFEETDMLYVAKQKLLSKLKDLKIAEVVTYNNDDQNDIDNDHSESDNHNHNVNNSELFIPLSESKFFLLYILYDGTILFGAEPIASDKNNCNSDSTVQVDILAPTNGNDGNADSESNFALNMAASLSAIGLEALDKLERQFSKTSSSSNNISSKEKNLDNISDTASTVDTMSTNFQSDSDNLNLNDINDSDFFHKNIHNGLGMILSPKDLPKILKDPKNMIYSHNNMMSSNDLNSEEDSENENESEEINDLNHLKSPCGGYYIFPQEDYYSLDDIMYYTINKDNEGSKRYANKTKDAVVFGRIDQRCLATLSLSEGRVGYLENLELTFQEEVSTMDFIGSTIMNICA